MLRRFAILCFLAATLCGQAFAAPEQWVEVRSQHFTVIADSNDKQGRHVLDQLERMRWMGSGIRVSLISTAYPVSTKKNNNFLLNIQKSAPQ